MCVFGKRGVRWAGREQMRKDKAWGAHAPGPPGGAGGPSDRLLLGVALCSSAHGHRAPGGGVFYLSHFRQEGEGTNFLSLCRALPGGPGWGDAGRTRSDPHMTRHTPVLPPLTESHDFCNLEHLPSPAEPFLL